MNNNSNIKWTGGNSSEFLVEPIKEKTLLGAKRAAKRFLYNTLRGEGSVIVFENDEPVWRCERSIQTRWREVVEVF